ATISASRMQTARMAGVIAPGASSAHDAAALRILAIVSSAAAAIRALSCSSVMWEGWPIRARISRVGNASPGAIEFQHGAFRNETKCGSQRLDHGFLDRCGSAGNIASELGRNGGHGDAVEAAGHDRV